ncbi:MAG: DEAD/DEAH box helicase, partial [Pseudobdellovibrionaceae bacterium]
MSEDQLSLGSAVDFSNVQLDSISLILDETALLKGPGLSQLILDDFRKYRWVDISREKESLSPRLFHLPEIFRRNLTTSSESYFHEVSKQNRLADLLRYNFSNGMQIGLREILRHSLHKKVPGDLLPQAQASRTSLLSWPFFQHGKNVFISQAVKEVENILQDLLDRVTTAFRRGQVSLFLQSKNSPGKAMRIQSLEFEMKNEVDWRVDFTEREGLEAEFKLVSFRKTPLFFFETFALEPKEGILLIHPWFQEFQQLEDKLQGFNEGEALLDQEMPRFYLQSDSEIKTILKHLRSRQIPVKITGESIVVPAHQSLTEIHLDEAGSFFLEHRARVREQKDLQRRGWTSRSKVFLETLSRGLPYLLNVEAKDLAFRSGTKRDWDLRLLKHLGILQFLCLEALHLQFEGETSDGRVVEKDQLFQLLEEKVKALLIAGSGGSFVQDIPLEDLCSKPVLASFERFLHMIFSSLESTESYFSEQGEVILEGLVQREFRLLLEILKKGAWISRGEGFRRSRTGLLSQISKKEDLFHFPKSETTSGSGLQEALESLQLLMPFQFQIYYKGQKLQELKEDEFHIDFILESDSDNRFFNWFELNPKFFLQGREIDPQSLMGMGGRGVIEFEGKIYLVPQKQIPSLRRLENFWLKLQKGKVESGKRRKNELIYQLPRNQTLELLALRASGVAIRGDWQWKEICEFYDNLGKAEREPEIPSTVLAVLKPYQKSGLRWLQDLFHLKMGALLADDMGLGKTLQTLAFLENLRVQKELGQCLIVVPSSLIFNWQQEIEKFTPNLPLTVFTSRDQDRLSKRIGAGEEMVVITTYGLLLENEAFLSQYKWKVAIFDEAQNLKNITTKRTSAARSLPALFKICLTGTPMENHYGEFYSLVDLLVPGSLGRIDDFKRQ